MVAQFLLDSSINYNLWGKLVVSKNNPGGQLINYKLIIPKLVVLRLLFLNLSADALQTRARSAFRYSVTSYNFYKQTQSRPVHYGRADRSKGSPPDRLAGRKNRSKSCRPGLYRRPVSLQTYPQNHLAGQIRGTDIINK